MNRAALLEEIKQEEGWSAHAYTDHLGFWTLGYGFLIDKRKGEGLPGEVASFWLNHNLNKIEAGLDRNIAWWRSLSEARQRALVNMAYQLGISGLMRFTGMLGALRNEDYELAAIEALDSRWARQTPERAARVAAMIKGD